MIKSELVKRLVEKNPHLSRRDVKRIVGSFLDAIEQALKRGDRVELRGFGAFAVKGRRSRRGRNPRTGIPVAIPERALPTFRPSKEMRVRINSHSPPQSDDE